MNNKVLFIFIFISIFNNIFSESFDNLIKNISYPGKIVTNNNEEIYSFRGAIDYIKLDDIKSYSSGTLAFSIKPDKKFVQTKSTSSIFETVNTDSIDLTSDMNSWGVFLGYLSNSLKFGLNTDKNKSQFYDIKIKNPDIWNNILITWSNGKISIYVNDDGVLNYNYDSSSKIINTDRVFLGSATLNNSFYSGYLKRPLYVDRVLSDDEIKKYLSIENKENYQINLFSMIQNKMIHEKDIKLLEKEVNYNGLTSYNFIKNIFKDSPVLSIDMDFNIKSQKNMHIIQGCNNFPGYNSGWSYSINYSPSTGLSLFLNTPEGILQIDTNRRLSIKKNYNIKVIIDLYKISIYINDFLVKSREYFNTFSNSSDFIMVGAGVYKGYYADMSVSKLLIGNVIEYPDKKRQIEHKTASDTKNEVNKEFKPEILLYSSVVSFVFSGVSLTLIPVFMGSHNYYSYYYDQLYGLYSASTNQQAIDIYYEQMLDYSLASNIFLTAGIVMIPLSVLSFSTGLILNIFYRKLKIKNDPNLNIKFKPEDKKIELSFQMRF